MHTSFSSYTILLLTTLLSPHHTLANPIFATAHPTTTTKPTATCSYVDKSPLPSSHHCNVEGRLLKHNNPFATPSGNSDAACLTACLNAHTKYNQTCKSFAHDHTVSRCDLYSTSIANSGNFKASMSNVWFWSIECFAESCATKTNGTTTAFSTTVAPSATTGASNATTKTNSISAPVTTVASGGNKCVIPLPLSIYDCKDISMPIAGSGYTAKYNLYYNGTGVVENSMNPGNPSPNNTLLPSFTTRLKNVDTGCDAATECVGVATGMGIGGVYMSFDVHYDLSVCRWMCVVYQGYNDDESYFNVVDKQAFRTHGYTAKMHKAG